MYTASPGEAMQHPILRLVGDGDAEPIHDLNEEVRRDLLELAERHLRTLAGSKSRWLPFLSVIASEAESPDERAVLGPV